jgi:hypothetical protein
MDDESHHHVVGFLLPTASIKYFIMQTYEEYPLAGIRKTLCSLATFFVYSAGIGATVYMYSVLTASEWFTKLYVLNILIFVVLLPLPVLVAHRCVSYIKRWFVWTEVGRRRAEKRGFF